MTRTLGLVLSFVLSLSVAAVGVSQGTPEAYQVVERFAEALSAGNVMNVREALGRAASWAEHDLFWRVASGEGAAQQRAFELIRGGVRLETELVAVVGDGRMVVTHERMWGDFVPEDLAPLRSTTVYLVEAGWLLGITRVLSAEQRDALLMVEFGDTTWWNGQNHYIRYGADGTFREFASLADLRSDDHHFSGTFVITQGRMTYVAGEDSRVCDPGERVPMRGGLIDQDTAYGVPLRDEIECGFWRFHAQPLTWYRFTDE